MIPAWLDNLKFIIDTPRYENHREDYIDQVGVLRFFSKFVEKWIDVNHISGNDEAREVIRSTLNIYTRICDWSLLNHNHPASDLRKLTIRMRGLLA